MSRTIYLGSPTLIEETGRESSTPIDQTDENSITSADTVKVIIDSGRTFIIRIRGEENYN